MMRKKYVQVTIPVEFRDVIEDVVADLRYGYRNAPEFARDAFRRLLIDLGALSKLPPKEESAPASSQKKV
jgi:Arc/MetJ-type ribon-helix-helix transcriptional regulator